MLILKLIRKFQQGDLRRQFGIPQTKILGIFEKYKNNKFAKINSVSIHIGSQIRI